MKGKILLTFFGIAGLLFIGWISYYGLPRVFSSNFQNGPVDRKGTAASSTSENNTDVIHLTAPSAVKAVYFSSWAAGTPSFRERLFALADETEINAVVIDIKDYSGKLSFEPENEKLKAYNSFEKRIRDLDEFIALLHQKGVYVIGRVAVFQDPYFVSIRPDLAVKSAASGSAWKDRKGLSWIDPGAKEFWDYTALIGEESISRGFDEINFDYIRFPSDGKMSDTVYPASGARVKADVMEEFFSYLRQKFPAGSSVISADLFGLVTTSRDDLGIGQVLERAAPHFDYIAPMVYPSHFAAGFENLSNPAAKPYEVIYASMSEAAARMASSSHLTAKLRPWLQDFDLGADYGQAEVRAQIKATYDAGLTSWMLWDPSNKYTKEALLTE